MPKVTDAHREARRRQILDAAWVCFARNGFQATSMQDLFAESGLSAGAVYRYFPSKNALVAAVADEAIGVVGGRLEQLAAAGDVPGPADALRALTTMVVDFADGPGYDRTRVALSVWAESLRDPEVAAVVRGAYGRLRQTLEHLVTAWQAAGVVAADASPTHVARTFFGTGLGFLVQRVLLGDVDPASYAEGFEALLGAGAPTAGAPTAGAPTAQPRSR